MIKANGYRSETEWITFDSDKELVVKLEKGSGTHERVKPTAQNPAPPEVGPDGKPIYKGTKGKLITTFPD